MDEEKRGEDEGTEFERFPTTRKLPESLVALYVPAASNAYHDEWDILYSSA